MFFALCHSPRLVGAWLHPYRPGALLVVQGTGMGCRGTGIVDLASL